MYKFSLREQNEKLKSELELSTNQYGHQERSPSATNQRRESAHNRTEQRKLITPETTGRSEDGVSRRRKERAKPESGDHAHLRDRFGVETGDIGAFDERRGGG